MKTKIALLLLAMTTMAGAADAPTLPEVWNLRLLSSFKSGEAAQREDTRIKDEIARLQQDEARAQQELSARAKAFEDLKQQARTENHLPKGAEFFIDTARDSVTLVMPKEPEKKADAPSAK